MEGKFKVKKRIIALLIVVILLFSFVACKSQGKDKEVETGDKSDAENKDKNILEKDKEEDNGDKETITIKYMTRDFQNAPTEATQLTYTELSKRIGIELDFQLVPNSQYNEKLNTVIASAEYPDLLRVGLGIINKHADDGIFTELNDLYEEYGTNALKEFEKTPGLMKDLKDDKGRMFFLPRLDYCELSTVDMINKDLLAQIGKDVPQTVDEFYECLVGFKELGDDIIPWGAGQWTDLTQHIFNAFGTSRSWLFIDGEVYYAPYDFQDKTKACIEFINKCYREGLIQQEYYTMSDDDKEPFVRSGKLGVFNIWQDGSGKYTKGDPRNIDNLNYVPLIAIEGPFGDRIADYRHPITDPHVIPSASKYADRIMQMYDYMATDEGKELMNWGVEGDTFVSEDGKRKYTEKITEHEAGVVNGRRHYGMDQIGVLYIMDADSWAQTVSESTVEIIEASRPFFIKESPFLTPTEEENERLAEIMTDIGTLFEEMYLKFVVGEVDIAKEWDRLIKEMEEMGIEEAIEIQKRVYARYKSR